MKKIIAFCLATALVISCTACNNNSKEPIANNTSEDSSAVLLANGERFYDVCSFVHKGDERAEEFVIKELSYINSTAKIVSPLDVNIVAVEEEDSVTKLRILMPDGMNVLAVNAEGTERVPVVYINSEETGDSWIAEIKVEITESVSLWAFEPSGGKIDAEIEVYPILA